jgi:hypothetical protein
MKASGKLNNKFLDLMVMFYAQNNPDQLKNPELAKGKDVVVGPSEIRDALQENDNNIIQLWNQTIKDQGKSWVVEYGWATAYEINPMFQKISIFGADVKIQFVDMGVSGVLGGISSIDNDPNTKVLWIIVKDNNSNLYLVPRLVNLAPDFTLSASQGGACRDDTTALDELDVPRGPLTDSRSKVWTTDSLYGFLGNPVNIDYNSEPFNQWQTSSPEGSKFNQIITECYVHGVPLAGRMDVTNPYYKPLVLNELTSGK